MSKLVLIGVLGSDFYSLDIVNNKYSKKLCHLGLVDSVTHFILAENDIDDNLKKYGYSFEDIKYIIKKEM